MLVVESRTGILGSGGLWNVPQPRLLGRFLGDSQEGIRLEENVPPGDGLLWQ